MRFRPILMTGLAFVMGVAPMVIAHGASAKSQQALGTGVMGGMIAVVVLALLMVPVFFVAVQWAFNRAARQEHPVLSQAANVFLLADEAHRTQYGGLAANLRRALPNAACFAFTGTPIFVFISTTPSRPLPSPVTT